MKNIIDVEATKYIDHIPSILKELIEIKALNDSIEIEFSKARKVISQLIDNRYVDTMDIDTTKRWEKILNLNMPINSTLEARRANISAKFRTKAPINTETLKGIVEAYLGVPVNIYLNEEPYTIKIKYRGLSKLPDLVPLYSTIYDVIPANMQLIITYAYQTWGEVKNLNNWLDVSKITWHDVLMGGAINE